MNRKVYISWQVSMAVCFYALTSFTSVKAFKNKSQMEKLWWVSTVAYAGFFQGRCFTVCSWSWRRASPEKSRGGGGALRHLFCPPSKKYNCPYTGYEYILVRHQPLWQATKQQQQQKSYFSAPKAVLEPLTPPPPAHATRYQVHEVDDLQSLLFSTYNITFAEM